jgi:type I restriction-modification system DNA methylase subunit
MSKEAPMTDSRRLVDKLWSYCDVLRDDGVGVIEYTEQLTYLLFLKMAHERATRRLHAAADRARGVLVAEAARRSG